MTTLYELTSGFKSLYNELTEREFDAELISDTIESTGLVDDIHDKAQGYALVLNQLEADAASLDAEIRRLTDRKQMFKSNAVKLKASLYDQLSAVGETKFKTNLFTFSTRKSQSVEITKMDLVPAEYVNEKVTVSADKTAIKAAIKSGVDVPGTDLINKESLVIK